MRMLVIKQQGKDEIIKKNESNRMTNWKWKHNSEGNMLKIQGKSSFHPIWLTEMSHRITGMVAGIFDKSIVSGCLGMTREQQM